MTSTNLPMFTTEAAAAEWHMSLPAHHIILAGEEGYSAAASDVQDAVEEQYLGDVNPDDEFAMEQGRKAAADAVNNAWQEGLSHDEWVSAALRSLRHAR